MYMYMYNILPMNDHNDMDNEACIKPIFITGNLKKHK